MRILFVTDFFPPETNAAATRVFERARYWVQWGHQVTVITSAPNFPRGRVFDGYRNRWYQVEEQAGIRVVRVKTFMAENQGKWRRGVDFVSFLFTAFPAVLREPRPDVIAATSPNFFAGVAACFAAITKHRPFVLEIGDLWPAFIMGVGEMNRSAVIRALEKLELFMYARSQRVVCVTDAFRENLIERGVPADKISVILNGVETQVFTPGETSSAIRERYNPDGSFTVGYFGTQGAAHGLDHVLDAARLLPDVRFLFAGDGAASSSLQDKAERLNLKNVVFIPPQPRDVMPDLWRLCDLGLIHLKNIPMLRLVIPSKVFEAMSTGTPILMAAPGGQATAMIDRYRCGLSVESGDPKHLAEAVCKLKSDPRLLKDYGLNGQEAARHFSREQQARLFVDVLAHLSIESNR